MHQNYWIQTSHPGDQQFRYTSSCLSVSQLSFKEELLKAYKYSDAGWIERQLGGWWDATTGEGDDGSPALEDAVEGARDEAEPAQAALRKTVNSNLKEVGGSPGLVVIREDSCSKGHGFESRRRVLDGHVFTFICCKNCYF